MATTKQKTAAKKNIKKAQAKWKSMTSRQRALSQPEGRSRKKPGEGKEGDYYHIVIRDKSQFTSFRYHDVGKKGNIQRLAGHRKSGSWATQKWIIEKKLAHVVGDKLVPDSKDVKDLFKTQLGSAPMLVKGDIFKAKPRPNVPEKDKPTKKQTKARKENIKKAQNARKK